MPICKQFFTRGGFIEHFRFWRILLSETLGAENFAKEGGIFASLRAIHS
jgi:hypothetical protein